MNSVCAVLFAFGLVSSLGASAYAAPGDTGEIVQLKAFDTGDDGIQGFAAVGTEVPVHLRPQGRYIIVEGQFAHPGWTLLVRAGAVPVKDGKFKLLVPITRQETYLQFRSVGPEGEVERQVLKLTLPSAPKDKRPTKFEWMPSVGYSSISYKQTTYPDLTETAVTAKLQARYLLDKSNWDIGVGAYMTAFVLGSTPTGVSSRFIGVNLRAGYTVPGLKDPWKLILMGGIYYTTMSVTGSALGFSNYLGPQIFPALSYHFAAKDWFGTYAKFAPIADGFTFLNLANREIAAGASWTHGLSNGHNIQTALDWSTLSATVSSSAISLQTISLGIGYSL